MNKSTLVFLANDSTKAVKATYVDDGCENIFKTFRDDITVGDLLVVPTSTRHGFTIVKVTEIDVEIDVNDNTEVKWVADRFDMETYSKNLTQEQEMFDVINSAEKTRRRNELKAAVFADTEGKLEALAITQNSDVVES